MPKKKCIPVYLSKLTPHELRDKVIQAHQMLKSCSFCGHGCEKNRIEGDQGKCKTGVRAKVSSFGPHHGEESPLSGWKGSGTIFFSRCNLRCQFCQNYDISQKDNGKIVDDDALAEIMLHLQKIGCHNINLVSPTHMVSPIISAIQKASLLGLNIPIVFNSGGYDSLQTVQLLNGIIDIYMPDMKYSNKDLALKYSKIPDYPKVNQIAVKEMHLQVGDLYINSDGIAEKGLLIRHLVLPDQLAGSQEIINFIANEISINTYLNIMDQYRPSYKASNYPELNRGISSEEFNRVIEWAKKAGLTRLDKRKGLFFLRI